MHLVEQIGSGVKRINQLMSEAKLPTPLFKTEGMFVVVVQRKKKTTQKTSEKTSEKTSKKTRVKTSEKILKLLIKKNDITIEELSIKLKISTRAIELQLNSLKKEGIIERIGPDKGGYWKIKA